MNEKIEAKCISCGSVRTISHGCCLKCAVCSKVTPWEYFEEQLYNCESIEEEIEPLTDELMEEIYADEEEI